MPKGRIVHYVWEGLPGLEINKSVHIVLGSTDVVGVSLARAETARQMVIKKDK
jgi:hypothetical protein